MIKKLITAVVVLSFGAVAQAASETLVDFSTFVKGTHFTIGTGKYADAYAAEQCETTEDGLTVHCDTDKQADPSASYFSLTTTASARGDVDWKGREFELIIAGRPAGRCNSNSITVMLIDSQGEVFEFKPSVTYVEDGNLHVGYRNIVEIGANGSWGGDGNKVIDGTLLFMGFKVQSNLPMPTGEITLKKIVSPVAVARTVEVVEPISLDTTSPGAAPFPGSAYQLEFALDKAYNGSGVWLYLNRESDGKVGAGVATNFCKKVSSNVASFDVDLDPTCYYHYNRLALGTGYAVVSGTGYFRQTQAEAMRLEVDTGNDLHICRDESERPKLVVRNPASVELHWTTDFAFHDTFDRTFVIPFDRTVPAGSSVDVEIPWPLPAMGVWYVKARVNGADGSEALKATQFAYIPRHEATARMSKPKFRFGILCHSTRYMPNETDKFLAALIAAGAKFTRASEKFYFSDICPSEEIYNSGSANWNWNVADTLLERLVDAGLSSEIIFYAAPSWAWDPNATWNQSEAGRNATATWNRPMKEGLLRHFCEEFGRRYQGKIDYYETGNEWNLVPRVTLSHDEGLAMQKEAYEGLHAGDPNACVCPNGWSGTGVSYGESHYTDPNYNWGLSEKIAEHPEYFDTWLIHQHGGFDSYAKSVDEQLVPLLHDTLHDSRPWVSGETALTSANGTEREQGAHVWYKTLFAWNRGARDYIWYNLKATGWFNGNEPGYGLMTADYHPRAGYAAFAAVTDIFEGLDADGTVYENGSRMLFRYKGTNLKGTINGIVLAGWDRGTDGTWQIQVETDATSAQISDHMGNRTEVEINGGVVEFSGSFLPKALILQGATRAEAPVVINGTEVTFTVDSGTLIYKDLIDDSITKIIKEGEGKLDFGLVTNTFKGVIYINAGTLSGDHGVYDNSGSFGTPTEVHVANGATWDIRNIWRPSSNVAAYEGTGSGTDSGKPSQQPRTPLCKTKVFVSGSGVDGNGAIVYNAVVNCHNLFGPVTLEGDTTFYTGKRWGIGSVNSGLNMNGYNLYLKGVDQFELGRQQLKYENPADIYLVSGKILFEGGGNVMKDGSDALTRRTVYVSSGARIDVYNGAKPPFIIHYLPSASSAIYMGYNNVGYLPNRLVSEATKLTVNYGTGGDNNKAYFQGGLTVADISMSGANLTVDRPVYIEGGATNLIGSYVQDRGSVTIRNTSTNRIGSITLEDGTFVLTNAVYNTIGSLTAKSLGRYMTLADAGFVVLTNIVKGTSSNREVPAESAAALQMGGTGQNEGITRLDIKGQTVVTGVAGTNVNTVWGGCFSMAHLDTWDRDILSLSDGAVMTNNFYIGGSSQTRMGAIYLDGAGTELFAPGRKAPDSSTMTWLGRTSAYAYLGIDHGATFSHGGYLTVGQSGRGFVVLRDGTVRYGASDNSRTLKLAREGMGYAQYCQFGGTFTKGPWGTGPARIWMGYCDSIDQATGSTSVFTVDGRGQTSPTAEVEAIFGYAITNQAAGKASTSIVNIGRGATLSATRICRTIQGFDWNTYKGLNYKNSPMYVNFNGGTLKARQKGRIFEASDSGAVDPLRFPTRITVYEGGATIDTSGFDVTVNAPLLKPYGKGVKSVTLTDAESLTANTAIGARRVVITDSTGIGADVITDFDLSTRTTAPQSIVTSPGLGYSDSVVAKVESVKNYVVLSNATIEVEELATTGGFTKRGAGTLTMNATNTWGGATRIEAGTLALGTGGKLPDGGDLFVARDAILDLNGVDMEVANLDCIGRILDGSVKVNGTMTISGSDIAATGGQGPVIFGKVTFGPSARVVLTNPEAIKGLKGPIKLLTVAGGFDDFPEIEGLDTVLADKKLKLDVKDGEFRLRRRTGTFLILDSEKREIPPMPTLANRPVTAQAVIRCTGVTNTADLVGVRRDDGGVAFTVKLADLPANAFEVEIDASCAAYTYTGGASDTGWWMTNRGQVGDLNRQGFSNIVSNKRTYLPYFAMKTANDTFIAIVEGMRFEYELRIKSANYRYTAAPVWLVSKDKIGFDPYEDMTLVVYQLPMDNDYNEMAKLYRSYRFAHDPDVQFFKERAKGRTNLARLAQTIAVRQQHASKPSDVGNADDSKNKHNVDYTPETEPPVSCKHPFKESLRTLRLLKEAGVDDIFFKVTGWQSGGWDGRHPDVFPVAVEAGGEEGLRLFIRGAKAMGYMIDAHENYTDCYTCSRMWDNGNIACTDLNGNFDVNGYWAGGRAYNLCLENALKTFLPQQLRDVAALGFWGCHYVDVFAAVHPYRCCNPAHAASRQKQWENQKTIARECRRLFGGFGSEACCDHMLGFVDYIHWVGEDINTWISNYNAEKVQNVDRIVPFYELAFHDVVLACADRYAYAAKVGTPANLLLIEYGGRPSFELNDPSRIPDVKAKYDEFKSLNCHWATEEMVEHKILVPNDNPDLPCGGFVRVTWGNGDKVYVNRTKSSQTADGVTVPANDYKVVRAP